MWTKRDALEQPGCLGNAADNEPVFIIRGQDTFMPLILEIWARLVINEDPLNEKAEEAMKFADEVREWQSGHMHKVPD